MSTAGYPDNLSKAEHAARADIMRARKSGDPDLIRNAIASHKVILLEKRIRKVLESAPVFTAEQRAYLKGLLD